MVLGGRPHRNADRGPCALVTGGAGFIGSHLVDRLLEDGHDVVVLDDLSTGDRSNVAPAARLEVVDVCDGPLLRTVVESYRPAHIFHLAAQIDVRLSMADPGHDARINVSGTVNVLDAALAVGAWVGFTSTGGAIYGDALHPSVLFSEQVDPEPGSPYGQAKLAAEGYVSHYARRGLSAATLRLANVYGPRQDPRSEAGVIAIFNEAKGQGRAVTIYGDGSQTRDFLHVSDAVRALRSLMGVATAPVNIGTGVGTSVRELAELMAVEHEYAPERDGEVRFSALDPSLALREFGFEAKVALAEGLCRLS